MKKKETQETLQPRRKNTPKFLPGFETGLSSEQVETHTNDGWTNEPVKAESLTIKQIIQKNVFTYFNLIFAILAVLLILAGSFRDLTFLPVIICNTLIGIIQETRSKKVLDNLNILNVSKVKTIRDGKEQLIPVDELVIEDIVIFEAGNQIPADAVVMNGEVLVNESLLTGESDEIKKLPESQLMSGSFVVSGKCYAMLTAVGADSYISKLTLEAKATNDQEQSEMIRALDKLVKAVGIAIIPLGIFLFAQQFFFGHASFSKSIISMVAAVIGMIPEGLYLLASVALAVSAIRLAQSKVMLHDMKCIETLARVNVLCVDKTGTITENTMSVHDVLPAPGYQADTMKPLKLLVGDFAAAMDSDNITMAAIKEAYPDTTGNTAKSHTAFSSVVKYSSVTFEDAAYVIGAPEFVLKEDYEKYKEIIEQYGSKGYRVLVFGTYGQVINGKELKEPVTPLGYILLANPIRKEAKSTFEFFAQQDVEIKVISGDNPVTVSEVAGQAGIANADRYVDASTLTSQEMIDDAVLNYTVFGRVKPEQKRQFVRALKSAGKTVAMTGDGVNDVLALKDADCSVAMASGSEAAVQAAQVVLLDSNFSCMPKVVMEGRRVVNNIQRSASLFLIKNIFSLLLTLFSLIFMYSYPLSPSQVSLISMFNIGIPAFFLALEPNKHIIEGHFLTNAIMKALPAALTDFICVAAFVVFGNTFNVPATDIATASTLLMAIVGFMILFKISQPMNIFRWIVWGGCVIGLVCCGLFLSNLFTITAMSKKCIMLFVVFAIASEAIFRYLSILVEFIEKKIKRKNKKERRKQKKTA